MRNCCSVCVKDFKAIDKVHVYNNQLFCTECYDMASEAGRKLVEAIGTKEDYNKPEHYHKHNIDTIAFLQEGFPPEVFMGFAIGHIIKYAQRANYKNGREDFVKMVDYAKRALDWYDKTHSK